MKKFLLLSLVLVLLFSLAACSKESNYEPFADWASEYNNGKMLSDSKLNSFARDFARPNRGGVALAKYIEKNNITVQEYGEIEFLEGKQLKNGDYAVMTKNITINYCTVVIRFKVVSKNVIEIIEVSPANYIGSKT